MNIAADISQIVGGLAEILYPPNNPATQNK